MTVEHRRLKSRGKTCKLHCETTGTADPGADRRYLLCIHRSVSCALLQRFFRTLESAVFVIHDYRDC